MAICLHPGIGEKFNYQRRKWQIIDLREGTYTCRTTDNDKKSEMTKTFDKETMIRICK
jgi:hypothetical protein